MFPDWALGVMGIIGTVATGIVVLSAVRILAQRGRAKVSAPPDPALENRLTESLDEVNHRLAELEERVDFHERLLSAQREKDRFAK
jgi:hypothetical protein